jgi:hypothetical protein
MTKKAIIIIFSIILARKICKTIYTRIIYIYIYIYINYIINTFDMLKYFIDDFVMRKTRDLKTKVRE